MTCVGRGGDAGQSCEVGEKVEVVPSPALIIAVVYYFKMFLAHPMGKMSVRETALL